MVRYSSMYLCLASLCDCVVCKHTVEVSKRLLAGSDTASGPQFKYSLKQLVFLNQNIAEYYKGSE